MEEKVEKNPKRIERERLKIWKDIFVFENDYKGLK